MRRVRLAGGRLADGDQPGRRARAAGDGRLVGCRRARPRGVRRRAVPRPADRLRLALGHARGRLIARGRLSAGAQQAAAPSPRGASSKPSNSNAGETMQPTSVQAPSGRAACQEPAGTTTWTAEPVVRSVSEAMDASARRRPRSRREARADRPPRTARPRPRRHGASGTARPRRGGTGSRWRSAARRRPTGARHVSAYQPPSGWARSPRASMTLLSRPSPEAELRPERPVHVVLEVDLDPPRRRSFDDRIRGGRLPRRRSPAASRRAPRRRNGASGPPAMSSGRRSWRRHRGAR